MTTRRPSGDHRWSRIMSLLAPGPMALGLHVFVDPAFWRAFEEARRQVAQRHQGDNVVAGRTER